METILLFGSIKFKEFQSIYFIDVNAANIPHSDLVQIIVEQW